MSQPDHRPYGRFILKAAAFGAALGTLAPALTITVFTGTHNGLLLHPVDAVETALLLLPITAVSCGSFGLITAVLGGSAVFLRRKRIRTEKRLLIESAILGFLLGCLFPFFDLALNSLFLRQRPQLLVIRGQLLFYPILGVLCALICAVAVRQSFSALNREAPIGEPQ